MKKGKLILTEKIEKIKNLKLYQTKFDAIIDVTSDYEYSVNSLANRREERNTNNTVIESISESISDGKIIKTDDIEENSLIQIVDAWNDFLCSGVKNNSDIEYSHAIKELKELKKQLEELKTENQELNIKLDESINLNSKLTEENNDLNQTQNEIIKLLDKKRNV